MNTDDCIFSQHEIEKIVNRAFDGERVKVLSYRLVRHSKDKVGFLGNHQNLELTIKRNGDNESEKHQLFVKSLPQMSEQQLQFIRSRNFFGHEAAYFNNILPLMQKYCPTTEDWCPKCLLANDEFVVLEDMRLQIYAMSSSKILSAEQLRAAFRAQARLHAASLVAEKRLEKPLAKLYPEACAELIFHDNFVKRKRLELTIDLAEEVAERLGLDGRRFNAGLRKGFYQMYDQSNLKTKLPKVFGHGDAWPNNYLFDTSNPSKCILVDFQLTRYGPPMYDLSLLMYFGTNRDFRQKELRKAIEAYHEQFCEVLEENDPEIRRPTLDEILEEYEELRMTAFFCAVMYYPIIWVDNSILAEYEEQEVYKKLVFPEDNSFVMQVYDKDEVFAARMNEIVEEVIEYFEKNSVSIEPNGLS